MESMHCDLGMKALLTTHKQMDELGIAISGSLNSFLCAPISQSTVISIECVVRNHLATFKQYHREFPMPFDGMLLTDIKCHMARRSGNLLLEWITAFYGGPRWKGQYGIVKPLGFHKGFDLYLGIQEPLPPTLIARFGHDPSEYETLNPFLVGTTNMPEHFADAINRAAFLNCPAMMRG